MDIILTVFHHLASVILCVMDVVKPTGPLCLYHIEVVICQDIFQIYFKILYRQNKSLILSSLFLSDNSVHRRDYRFFV